MTNAQRFRAERCSWCSGSGKHRFGTLYDVTYYGPPHFCMKSAKVRRVVEDCEWCYGFGERYFPTRAKAGKA